MNSVVVMLIVGILLFGFSLVVGGLDIYYGVVGHYEYQRDIGSNWDLAVKASTLQAKEQYTDKFVTAIENAGLQGTFDAYWLQTPDNSFDENLAMLKTLQARLHEIEKMDVSSFQYQTAIAQITAQEQGEANAMLSVFGDCWWKAHHWWLWSGLGIVNCLGCFFGIFIGIALFVNGADEL